LTDLADLKIVVVLLDDDDHDDDDDDDDDEGSDLGGRGFVQLME